jgi:large subunit ribosomal protein L15
MNLNDINEGISSHRKRKRIGRGVGSGWGKTSGRGHKGQGARSGYSRHPAFNGGQLPMVRRLPKRGFFNKFAQSVVSVNVRDLERTFEAGADVNPQTLRDSGLVKLVCDEIKILGEGEITKALNVTTTRVSQTARQKIEAAGGTIKIVQAKRTPKQRVAELSKKS